MNRLGIRRFVLVLAATLGLVAGAVGHVVATTSDPRLSACGVSSGAQIVASFDIAHGQDIWQHLPAMAQAPSLTGDDRPAFVIVYGPSIPAPVAVGGLGVGPPKSLANAVCVVQADGTGTLHYNVSRKGMIAP